MLTPTLNSIVPQSTNMVEFPSFGSVMRPICVYRMMPHTVVKIPRPKMPIRPSFLERRISSFHKTGTGSIATTMSETMVTTA